jgi:hypothetical protein
LQSKKDSISEGIEYGTSCLKIKKSVKIKKEFVQGRYLAVIKSEKCPGLNSTALYLSMTYR